MNNIDKYRKKIQKTFVKEGKYLTKIERKRRNRQKYEEILSKICDHEWERDYTDISEHSVFRCKICLIYD